MTAGDDEKDDPMLRGMRSVWLEMRDEDPPASGLAELLAAARDQAAGMEPAEEAAPWWRRAFAMMVRPPMLAAATVVVLIGGAVVLKGRNADEAVAPSVSTIEESRREPQDDDKHLEKQAATPIANTPAIEPEPQREATTGFGSGTARQVAPAPVPRARPPADPVRPPPPKPVLEAQKSEKGEQEAAVTTKDKTPDKVQQQPGGGLVIANDGEGGRVTTEDKPATTGVRSQRPAPAPDSRGGDSVGRKEQRQVSQTDQLVKQTEVAASRNDCAAVRVTAERIKKLDATAYKTRVANQPAIARCLK